MTRRPQDREEFDSDEDTEGKAPDGSIATLPRDIVDLVARRFAEDEAFCVALDEWVDAKCAAFADDDSSSSSISSSSGGGGAGGSGSRIASGSEYDLVHTALHEEFKAMYEKHLEGYIAAQGATVADFYATIRASEEVSGGQGSAALVGQILLATFDFDVFRVMMREAAHSSAAASHK
jgi:hypothetical protein